MTRTIRKALAGVLSQRGLKVWIVAPFLLVLVAAACSQGPSTPKRSRREAYCIDHGCQSTVGSSEPAPPPVPPCGGAGQCPCTLGESRLCSFCASAHPDEQCLYCGNGYACAGDSCNVSCRKTTTSCPQSAPITCGGGVCCPRDYPVCCPNAALCATSIEECSGGAGGGGNCSYGSPDVECRLLAPPGGRQCAGCSIYVCVGSAGCGANGFYHTSDGLDFHCTAPGVGACDTAAGKALTHCCK
jgi:hypothetical protein